ncbi:uncharacterized protein TRUGW13939_09931 [Talaromyces rugulosus]|uniref:Uncharacterized protein n=1 Tax=Talaromyces rugulosus TaxID=121627 RepID=A0A7H8R8Z4_TALRU|nr:uncharacterized protein TRUGW13939_09931 [Talaromyces rugulosus]QKX62766.1 hypothetical protein TRUGW13939_09931 [Talaromyces rugulosus]
MSLKRKASFSSYQPEICSRPVDNTPQHLSSRTRKRFRDNRPNEQTVYEKTLRILYDAQKRPMSSNPEEQMALTPPPCDPEALDPRQQTLRKFFQPIPAQSSSMDISGMMQENRSNGPNGQFSTFQSQDPEYNQSGPSSGSSTPLSAGSETDMNMNNTNTGFQTQGKWIGGIGWV